ncbi:MAG: hypothetical protein KDJ68_13045 [Rhodobiaceae bacterium]|nr:hypothetical protein [Rhodobiaceae bacterium]
MQALIKELQRALTADCRNFQDLTERMDALADVTDVCRMAFLKLMAELEQQVSSSDVDPEVAQGVRDRLLEHLAESVVAV